MGNYRSFEKLKKELESLFLPELKITFNKSIKTIHRKKGDIQIPRFFVKQGREVIWDFPKHFSISNFNKEVWANNHNILAVIREYLNTPAKKLLTHQFIHEDIIISNEKTEFEINYHVIPIFIAADRRLNQKDLFAWSEESQNKDAIITLEKRFNGWMPNSMDNKWIPFPNYHY